MKMHFGFILLLALGAIVDFHVELRRPNVEVKSHEENLDGGRGPLQIATSRP
jgi:hypothetical protein